MRQASSWMVLTVSGGFAKQTRERSREVIGYLTRLEQGLFGTHELSYSGNAADFDLPQAHAMSGITIRRIKP